MKENYRVFRMTDGRLGVVTVKRYMGADGGMKETDCCFPVYGDCVEGLKEGDVLCGYNLDYDLRQRRYMEDGKNHAEVVMVLHGWQKVKEA